jgi:hypothetical protein
MAGCTGKRRPNVTSSNPTKNYKRSTRKSPAWAEWARTLHRFHDCGPIIEHILILLHLTLSIFLRKSQK